MWITMNAILLFLGGVGFQEILLIGLFVLIFFGAKKIPEFMKGLGKGVREFKDSMNDVKRDLEDTGREASKKIEDNK
jgi:sec-independent protein translocase protein TatA